MAFASLLPRHCARDTYLRRSASGANGAESESTNLLVLPEYNSEAETSAGPRRDGFPTVLSKRSLRAASNHADAGTSRHRRASFVPPHARFGFHPPRMETVARGR